MESEKKAAFQNELSSWELLAAYFQRPGVLLSTLLLTTAVLYSGTVSFGFVWDDGPQIVNNPLIRSWHNLSRVFVSDLWYHTARQQVYYRPLFVAWSILNYALVGLHPWGWHMGAILLHLGAILAVFWLARCLALEYWTAALATLIFALHPIHIECVAWISAASDSMVTMFTALAFCTFLKARDASAARRWRWRMASWILLACALLTKEMAIAFAVLVAIYAWMWPRDRQASAVQNLYRAMFEALPYVLVTLIYILLRKLALLHAVGAIDKSHGILDVFGTLPLVLSLYLKRLLLPLDLTGLYYTPYVNGHFFSAVIIPAVALLVLAIGIWYWSRREGNVKIVFAGLWLLVSLSPALYLRNFGNGDFVRDRYMYLPSVGFAILLAIAIRRLPGVGKWNAAVLQGIAVLALFLFYAVASFSQQVQWGSDFLVLLRGQQLYPDNPYTLVGLSAQYSQRGAHDKAIELAEIAVHKHPEYGYSRFALAEAYIRAGRFDDGREWLQQALQINPEYATSETGMAALAGLYGRMGDYGQALGYCDQILAKDPNLYSALFNCGVVNLRAGHYMPAERLLSRAIVTAPQESAPRHFLGRALLEDGKNQEAQEYLESALRIDPKVWDYHFWMAESLRESGNLPAAREEYREALQLNPDSSEAMMRLTALEGK